MLCNVPGVRHTPPISFHLLSSLLITEDVAILVLQMMKVKLREFKRLAQGQRAFSWRQVRPRLSKGSSNTSANTISLHSAWNEELCMSEGQRNSLA